MAATEPWSRVVLLGLAVTALAVSAGSFVWLQRFNDAASQVAARLVAALTGSVDCSAGVATWDAGQDLDQLLHTSDQALYAVKQRHEDARAES